ncbi:putative transporter svop-1 isoform X2 [Oscarella lobularis]|uniref:putative transporter svop-1 isoform X2 n=1 Tax=Oscarella lobularis TaxID=121494 RepID=UPI0033140D4F
MFSQSTRRSKRADSAGFKSACLSLQVVDAMEIMLLAVLGPAARCEYNLTAVEEGLITTSVFIGNFLGAGVWGALMDRYGRKKGLFVVCIFVCTMGLLSAFSFSYWYLLLTRGLIGFGISGGAQAVTFYSEFLPAKQRAYCLLLIQVFFAMGTLFEVILALVVMVYANLGWHYLLGFTTVPLFLDLFAFWLVPESARFYVASGEMKKARAVLEKVARTNKKSLPPGRLVSDKERTREWLVTASTSKGNPKKKMTANGAYIGGDLDGIAGGDLSDDYDDYDDSEKIRLISKPKEEEDYKKSRGNLKDLFASRELKITTCLLWFIWFGAAFGYYGIVLLTTEMLEIIKDLTARNLTDGTFMPCHDFSLASNMTNETKCSPLVTEDYLHMLWTTSAELPGILLTAFIIERIGRKKTMAAEFAGCIIGFFLMYICPVDKYLLMFFVFLVRGLVTGAFQAAYVYTPEVYPTSMRAIGLGMCSTVARLGSMSTPFIAQVLTRKSLRGTEGTYAGVFFLAGICSLLLPIETKGKRMKDVVKINRKT